MWTKLNQEVGLETLIDVEISNIAIFSNLSNYFGEFSVISNRNDGQNYKNATEGIKWTTCSNLEA